MPARTVLILGGTREAAMLADRLSARPDLRVITSLAGRTREPGPVAGETRIGGFGGIEGLSAYLRETRIDLLVDATHPFAARISANATEAAAQTGIRLLGLEREPWRRQEGDIWIEVPNMEAATAALPAGAIVLLALGRQHIADFARRADATFVIRMVDPPETPLPFERHLVVLGRPSADPQMEAALLRRHGVTHIVCRNSGGPGAYAKIEAARALRLPVIMIARPPAPSAGERYADIEALAAAIA